jgi:hypothetical protein
MHDVVRRGTATRALAAQARRPGRQDRHHQRFRRRLVLRLPADPGRRRLDRLRPAEKAGQRRNGRLRRPADLDRLHGKGAEGVPETHMETPKGLISIIPAEGAGEAASKATELIYKESLPPPPPESSEPESPQRMTIPPAERVGLIRKGTRSPACSEARRSSARKLGAVAGADPAAVSRTEMEAAGARRHPDLAGSRMAIDDDLAAVAELQLQHAAGLQFVIDVGAAGIQRRSIRQRSPSARALNSVSSITSLLLTSPHLRGIMRTFAIAAAACGFCWAPAAPRASLTLPPKPGSRPLRLRSRPAPQPGSRR